MFTKNLKYAFSDETFLLIELGEILFLERKTIQFLMKVYSIFLLSDVPVDSRKSLNSSRSLV
jgi:hypothetical protein